MQAEDSREEENISLIIESNDIGQVTLVDGNVVPLVDCFVAAEDITETVIASSNTLITPSNAVAPTCDGNSEEVAVKPDEGDRAVKTSHSTTASGVSTSSTAPVAAPPDPSTEREEGQVVEVKVIPIEMLYDGTLWSQLDFTKTGDEEMLVSESDNVPLSDGVTDVARQVEVTTRSDNMCLSIRDITKREKDRQKKRVLRANPQFREKEKQKAKERMQSRRQDPVYREQERQRDRERRQQARRRNHTLRERERERDKEYKKNFRYGNRTSKSRPSVTDTSQSQDSFPCQVYLNTSYNTESS